MSKITCPHCGYDGSKRPERFSTTVPFLLRGTVRTYRDFMEMDGDIAVFDLDSYDFGEDTLEDYDLFCNNCGRVFPLPPGFSWEER